MNGQSEKRTVSSSIGRRFWIVLTVAVMIFALLPAPVMAEEVTTIAEKKEVESEKTEWAPVVEPKPLSNNVNRGLDWLVEHQHPNGGWSQGEESTQMGNSLAHLKDQTNVGDTCAAILALIRSGSTPKKGPYAETILKGIAHICDEIEGVDSKTLFVTKTTGTRLQMKLGTYIDTFLSSMVLAEAKGNMPTKQQNKRVTDALNLVMAKIEENQQEDGTFGGSGWANTLSQSMAVKGMNRAKQAGAELSEEARVKVERYAQSQFDVSSGDFSSKDSAGVQLYAGAANLGAMQDSANTNYDMKRKVQEKLDTAQSEPEREEARDELKRIDDNEVALEAARGAIVKKLDDQQFVSGFGSNGGEEFLSYMNIGESLVTDGGQNWKKWDKEMTANLNRIQNQDGSWSGHHCITGRTFCTSAALLVLMTDRAPVPVAAEFKRR